MSHGRARGALLLTLLATLSLCLPPAAIADAPLSLGFFDGAFTGSTGSTWLAEAAGAGADVVRIDIGWVAPSTATRPVGFDARNPADPRYDWTAADRAIREATADGMRVIVEFTGAPRWAEGPGRPRSAAPGTWRPRPAAVEDYAIALARRYSGRFPDPADPLQHLPRVWAFQLWNEPNLSDYLSPQWVSGQPASPGIYRGMLNAFYAGIKSVDSPALVVTAGTAPFGDPNPGGQRLMPVAFWRGVLCEGAPRGALVARSCPHPAHFDVLAHHPYSVGAPDTAALNADDVSIPDMGKLTRVLRFAERHGTVLPAARHPLWVTETGYNTRPPNPYGVPAGEAARWLAQALGLLWRQGVSLITWNTIVDQPPVPSYGETSQSGVYYLDGQAKPGLAAFRFPLTAWRLPRGRVEVWGRSPATGRVRIERRAGSAWRTVASQLVGSGDTFTAQLVDSHRLTVRATIDRQMSIPWYEP